MAARAVGVAPRRTQTASHGFAVAGVALRNLRKVWRVLNLIVRGVELGLVHVEPYRWCLDPRRLLRGRGLLAKRGAVRCDYRAREARAQKCPSIGGLQKSGCVRVHILPILEACRDRC